MRRKEYLETVCCGELCRSGNHNIDVTRHRVALTQRKGLLLFVYQHTLFGSVIETFVIVTSMALYTHIHTYTYTYICL